MDHNRATIGVEDRALAWTQGNTVGGRFVLSTAVRIELNIGQVTGMRTLRILQAMLRARRIQVTAGRAEGRFTHPRGMDVDAMSPCDWIKAPEFDPYLDRAGFSRCEGGLTHDAPLYIPDFSLGAGRCRSR